MSRPTAENLQLTPGSVTIIREIAARHHARHPRVFGSHSRGSATENSDVDLLVECDAETDLYDLIALKQDLEDALGCNVDVVEEAGLSPYLRDRVLSSPSAMKDDGVYLAHIRDAIQRIESYTQGGEEAFMREPMIQDAVMRNLEIIGEATKNLSDDFRKSHPDIPWRQMAGMRDVLIHDYLGVNVVRVWGVVAGRLPELMREVSKILGD